MFLCLDEDGNLSRREREGSAAVTLLVPSADLLLTSLSLQAKRDRDLSRALPYAMEDRLAGDPTGQHLVLAAGPDRENRVWVMVVAREKMIGWLRCAEQACGRVDHLVPDVLALPWQPGDWSLLYGSEKVLLRSGEWEGFTLASEDFLTLAHWKLRELSAAGQASGPVPEIPVLPGALRVWCCPDVPPPVTKGLEDHFQGGLVQEGEIRDPLDFLAENLAPDVQRLNLLRGEFRPASQTGTGRLWWFLTGAIALLALLLFSGFAAFDKVGADRAAAAASRQAVALFRESFPQVNTLIDLRAQTLQQLEWLRQAEDGGPGVQLTPMFAPVAGRLAAQRGLGLESLNFSDNQLTLQLSGTGLSDFEALRNALHEDGFSAEIQSIDSDASGKVRGRMLINREAQ